MVRRRLLWLAVVGAGAAAAVAYRPGRRPRDEEADAGPVNAEPEARHGVVVRETWALEAAPTGALSIVRDAMEWAPSHVADFESNGSPAAPESSSAARQGVPTARRQRGGRGETRKELGPVELPPRRWPSGATLAALALTLGLAALGLGAWGIANVPGTDHTTSQSGTQPTADDGQLGALLSGQAASSIPLRHSGGHLTLVVGANGEGALVLRGLQEAPSGRSYQAWVVSRANARPLSAALFSGTESVVPLSVSVPAGAVVAVTVEPAGGVSSPAGELRLAATRPSSS